jgi:DNA-binding response OmpR family regulator
MRVLIVEDDPGIASFVEMGLAAEGYVTVVAPTIAAARAEVTPPGDLFDAVVLDLGLPDGDGASFLADIRANGVAIPVIILSARGEVDERVRGLNAGANDYLPKPFAFAELVARLRAVLRSAVQPTSTILRHGDVELDLLRKVAVRRGRTVELAPREWALLELFLRHPGQVLTRAQILSAVWDYSFDPGSNVVDVYVGYLRRKLDVDGEPSLVQTIRGAGYRLTSS